MDFYKVVAGLEYEVVQQGNIGDIASIAIDSRNVAEKSLFICLTGLNVDGHSFISEVAEKGASAIIVDTDQTIYPENVTILKVADSRQSLSIVAANFYNHPEKNLNLVGITGTNGKTSTTYMVDAILREAGKISGVIGTVGLFLDNKPVDIPFATSTTPDPLELQHIFQHFSRNSAKYAVMEVSSHALALRKMEGLLFEVAIFTNLTQDHLDFHGSMENYLNSKEKLFEQCNVGIVNADDIHASHVMAKGTPQKWITFGIVNDCDIKITNITSTKTGFDLEIDLGSGSLENFQLNIQGRFNIYNALAAIAATLSLGIDLQHIKRGIANFTGVPGRIQRVPTDRDVFVCVDYAHSPDGLQNIITAVREFTSGSVITVFGCGGDRDSQKRPLMGKIAGSLSDFCIITSDNPRTESPTAIIAQTEVGVKETECPYELIEDRRKAIFRGISMLKDGDALIIAGKGHEDYQILGTDKIHFDDFEVAQEAFKTVGLGCSANA